MTNDFISIGKITSTFGLKGSVKVASSGDVLSSLGPNSYIYLEPELASKSYKLIAIRKDKNQYIVLFEGFKSIEESVPLIGKILYFPKGESEALLADDEYFIHQLIGLQPFLNNTIYSEFTLREVIENPAHPILLFTDGDREILIPYINQFIGQVDLGNSRIEVFNWEDWLDAD